jgi:hypothetical protein
MDFSHKKIVFRASKNWGRWGIYFFVVFSVVFGLLTVYDFFSDPREAYHGEDSVLTFCLCGLGFSLFFYLCKTGFVRDFYITEDGVILRQGLSGKWYTINFKKIAVVAAYKFKGSKGLKIFCRNQKVFNLGTGYKNSSIDSAIELLENQHIRVYEKIKDAKKAAAGYVMEETANLEQSGDLTNIYLHYCVTFLPIFIVAYMLAGVMINKHYGTQEEIAMYGTVADKEISYNKQKKVTGGKILLRNAQSEERFPVNSSFILQAYIGERLKVHYKKGSLGLGYGVTFTKY